MPNIVGPETMRDILYENGIKDPRKLNEVMRAIAQHVTYCCQRRHPELEGPEVLLPGNPEMKIRCSDCDQVKTAGTDYYRRHDTVSGWGLKCITCQRKPGRPEGHVPSNKKDRADDLSRMQAAGPREVSRG